MPDPVAFFAVHADDIHRARRFYERVFGWRFEPWGPPDFYLIDAGFSDGAIRGALHPRMTPLEGKGIRGYECSVSVESVDDTRDLIVANGGTILHEKTTIPGVGWVVRFADTEQNEAGIVQYDDAAG